MSNSSKNKGPCSGDSPNADMTSSAISGIGLETKSPCIAYLVMQEQLREEAEARHAAQQARNAAAKQNANANSKNRVQTVGNSVSNTRVAQTQNVKSDGINTKSNVTPKKPGLLDKMASKLGELKNTVQGKIEDRKVAQQEKEASFAKLLGETYDFILKQFNVPYTSVCVLQDGGTTTNVEGNAKKGKESQANTGQSQEGKAESNAEKGANVNASKQKDNVNAQVNATSKKKQNVAINTEEKPSNSLQKISNANAKQGDEISNAARNAFLYVLVNGTIPSSLVELITKEEFTSSKLVQDIVQDKTLSLLVSSVKKKKSDNVNDSEEEQKNAMEGGKSASTVEEAFALCVKFFMKQVKKMGPSPTCSVKVNNTNAGTIAAISYGTHYQK